MNILFLCTYYHRAMIFHDLRDELRECGNDVRVFNAAVKGDSVKPKYYEIMDEFVIHQECFNKFDRFFYHLKQGKFLNAVENSYDVNRFDIIHSHTLFNGGYVAHKLKEKYGTPYYVTVRGTDIYFFLRTPGFKSIGKKLLRHANGIVVLSRYAQERVLSLFKGLEREEIRKKILLTYNGLEKFWTDNIGKLRQHDNSKEWNLLCVGKINKDKNILRLSDAINMLNKKGLRIRLKVVGQIVDKSVNNQLTQGKQVALLGYMTKEQLIEVYRDSDVFAMPSIRETFGRVYAEAMSQGLPVLYSENEGFDGIFEQGEVGVAVNPFDINSIADGIEDIINSYSEISQRALEKSHMFDWRKIAIQYVEMYRNRG